MGDVISSIGMDIGRAAADSIGYQAPTQYRSNPSHNTTVSHTNTKPLWDNLLTWSAKNWITNRPEWFIIMSIHNNSIQLATVSVFIIGCSYQMCTSHISSSSSSGGGSSSLTDSHTHTDIIVIITIISRPQQPSRGSCLCPVPFLLVGLGPQFGGMIGPPCLAGKAGGQLSSRQSCRTVTGTV